MVAVVALPHVIMSHRRYHGLDGAGKPHDRPDLDTTGRAATFRRDLGRPGQGLVQLAIQNVVASQLLLGLGKRTVGYDRVAVLDPYRGSGLSPL